MPEGSGPVRPPVAPGDRPVLAAGVASVDLDGEIVLLDEIGQAHLLNATASLLLPFLDGEVTIAEIAAEAADAFGAPAAVVLADVCTFTGELEALGMVTVAPQPAASPPPS